MKIKEKQEGVYAIPDMKEGLRIRDIPVQVNRSTQIPYLAKYSNQIQILDKRIICLMNWNILRKKSQMGLQSLELQTITIRVIHTKNKFSLVRLHK